MTARLFNRDCSIVLLRWVFKRLRALKDFSDVHEVAGMMLKTFTAFAKCGRKSFS
jgi:hypothetical protein